MIRKIFEKLRISIIIVAMLLGFCTALLSQCIHFESGSYLNYYVLVNNEYVTPSEYNPDWIYYEKKTETKEETEIVENHIYNEAEGVDETNYKNYYIYWSGAYWEAYLVIKDFDPEIKYYSETVVEEEEIKVVEYDVYTAVDLSNDMKFFTADKIKKPEFWITTICVTAANLSIYFGVYLIVRNKLVESKECIDTENTYNDRLKLKTDNFYDYCREDNLNEKKKAYKEKYKSKLENCKIKYSKYSLEELNSRRAKRLHKKIEYLESITTQEFIDSHIMGISANKPFAQIHYEEIHPSNFKNSMFANISERKDHSEEVKKMSFRSSRKLITSAITSSFIALLVIEKVVFKMEWSSFLIMILSTMFGAILQCVWGYFDSIRMYKYEIITPLYNKTKILEKYVVWKGTHPENNPDFKMIMSKYLDEKINAKKEKDKEETKEIKQ